METIKRSRARPSWGRPFANLHWFLLLLLVLPWVGCILGAVCEPVESLPCFPVLVTFTVCSALWDRYLRALPVKSWRGIAGIIGGAIYDYVVLNLCVIIIAGIFPVAAYSCIAKNAKVSELIGFAVGDPAHEEIARRIGQRHSVSGTGAGLHLYTDPTFRINDGLVTDDGIIVIVGKEPKEPDAVVILEPRLGDGGVEWKCSGLPTTFMPSSCRSSYAHYFPFP